MRISRLTTLPLLVTALIPAARAATNPQSTTTTTHATVKHASTTRKAAAHHDTPGAIPSERATQIQTALIKQGYLSGEPSGAWDAQTVAAMQKLQGDNGWQTRITPDARALIKLGLGPQDATATTTPPQP
jgi:hypothetical protein